VGKVTKSRRISDPETRNKRLRADRLNVTSEERALLPDPDWMTEDDADFIIARRREQEPGKRVSLQQVLSENAIDDPLESVLMAELEELRRSEEALQKMYLRLRSRPKLRPQFLKLLHDLQQRTGRMAEVVSMPFSAPSAEKPKHLRRAAKK